MTIEAINYIGNQLKEAEINIEFGQWNKTPVPDPYFVAEFSEMGMNDESGQQNATLMLTGVSKSWVKLEKAKQTINNTFNHVTGKTAILSNGNGLAVFYDSALTLPTEDPELKRLQINLLVKEWSV